VAGTGCGWLIRSVGCHRILHKWQVSADPRRSSYVVEGIFLVRPRQDPGGCRYVKESLQQATGTSSTVYSAEVPMHLF
jgi:hypothetical protein